MTKITFAEAARRRPQPHETLRLLNEGALGLIKTQEFISAIALLLEPDGSISYSSAGHPPGFLHHRATGHVETLKTNGALLGLFEEASASYTTERALAEQGDRIILYTDGISEAMDADGRVFGTARIRTLLAETNSAPLEEALRIILEAWRAHGEAPDDDATLLLIERRP